MNRIVSALLLAAAALLAGCASEPRVMRMEDTGSGPALLFPAPQTQEVPRYRYLGQLVGETNFKAADDRRSKARKFLEWVAGLTGEADQPQVLQRPQSGVVDAAGRVLVTDVSRNAVFVFDEAGGKFALWDRATAVTRFAAPIGIALGRGGEVLVADAELGRVFRLDAEGRPLGAIAAPSLLRPTGIARDPARGRIYVADTRSHDIKVFDDDGHLLATWGRRGEQPGEFNYPTHLVVSNGRLVVCDALNARVQVLDADGRPVLTIGERGRYVGNLVRPKGVAVDDEGNIYVIESMYDTLLVYDRQGRLLMSLGGTGSEPGRFYLPAGVWVDSRNRVFVADMFNGRVPVFQFLGGN